MKREGVLAISNFFLAESIMAVSTVQVDVMELFVFVKGIELR